MGDTEVIADHQAAEISGTREIIEDPILETEEMKKLFVGGIPTDSKDEDLKSFFEQISGGAVTDHVIIRKENKSHFGFITFESSLLIDEILLKRKDFIFNGKTLDVKRAVPKNNTSDGAREKTTQLFIANLPKHGCSEEELKEYFVSRHDPKFGVVESVKLVKKKDDTGNKTDENKGFGFVTVSSEDMADKMVIQHSTFDFCGRKIELKKSVPTGEGSAGRGRGRGRGASMRGGRGRGDSMRGGRSRGASILDGRGNGQYGGGQFGAVQYGDNYGRYEWADHFPYGGGYGNYGNSYSSYGGGGYASTGRGGRGGRGAKYTPYY